MYIHHEMVAQPFSRIRKCKSKLKIRKVLGSEKFEREKNVKKFWMREAMLLFLYEVIPFKNGFYKVFHLITHGGNWRLKFWIRTIVSFQYGSHVLSEQLLSARMLKFDEFLLVFNVT